MLKAKCEFFKIFLISIILFSIPLSALNLANSQGKARGVILMVWDGVRFERLVELLHRGRLPNLSRIISEGVMVRAFITDHYTCTDASVPVIVSGAISKEELPIPAGLTIWERLKDKIGNEILLGLVSGKSKITKRLLSNSLECLDLIFSVDLGDPYAIIDGRSIAEEVLSFLDVARSRKFFLYIHLAWPDILGHRYGEGSEQYNMGIMVNDRFLGEIIEKLEKLQIYESTLIIVTTDHGFYEGGISHDSQPYPKGDPNCYTVFIALNKVLKYIDIDTRWAWDQNDIAPTVYAFFQIDYELFKDLKGYAIWDRKKGWSPKNERPSVYLLSTPIRIELLSPTSSKIYLKPGDEILLTFKLTSMKWMPLRDVTILIKGEASSWLKIDAALINFKPLESKVVKAKLKVPSGIKGVQELWIGYKIGSLSLGIRLTLMIGITQREGNFLPIIIIMMVMVTVFLALMKYIRDVKRS